MSARLTPSSLSRTFLNTTTHRLPQPNIGIIMRSRAHFSTTRAQLSSNTPTPNANANANPSYPAFSLKRISPNPRVRMALGAGLAVLAAGEGYLCMKYWPKITGKENKGEGEA